MPTGSKVRGIDASAAKMAFTSLAKYTRPSCSQKWSGQMPVRSRAKYQATGFPVPEGDAQLSVHSFEGGRRPRPRRRGR